HIGPCHDDVSGIDHPKNQEGEAVKPEIRYNNELCCINCVSYGVPEYFPLTFPARAEIALVIMKIDDVKYSEVAGNQQYVKRSLHQPQYIISTRLPQYFIRFR